MPERIIVTLQKYVESLISRILSLLDFCIIPQQKALVKAALPYLPAMEAIAAL